MRLHPRSSRRLAATMAAAVALSACGVGVTSLTSSEDVAQAVRDAVEGSRTVTITTQATLDADELAQLRDLSGRDHDHGDATDVVALQTLLDGAAVQLTTAEDDSRRAALLWEGDVALDLRVDATDFPEAEQAQPFDLTASARLDVAVLLRMVLAAKPDITPAELLDLRSRLTTDVDRTSGEVGEALPEQVAEILRTLLAGEWVSVAGTIEPPDMMDSEFPASDLEDAISSAWTLSEPSPAGQEGQTSTATLDVGALASSLAALMPEADEEVTAIDLVLTDLVRFAFDVDGRLIEARTDVLDVFSQGLSAAADTVDDAERAARARQAAVTVAGWERTSVVTTATVADDAGITTVMADVVPALTLTWQELRELAERR